MDQKRTLAFWFLIIIGFLLIIVYLLGQTMAFINYDFTVAMDLQEPTEEITSVGVAFNKGFGVGDTFLYIPLFILGIYGMWHRKTIGLYSMFGAMAITAYWPIVCLTALYFAKGSEGFHFTEYSSYTVILSLITLYGIWGMWYIFTNRNKLTEITST